MVNSVLGFGGRGQGAVARAPPVLEAIDGEALPKAFEGEGRVLLYGSMQEAYRAVEKVIRGSDRLVALVGCGELMEGHRQIAVNGPLGRSTYESIQGLGFLPDLIVARCGSIGEAAGLAEWAELGSQLICMVEPRGSDHDRWDSAGAFGLQVFCGGDGVLLAGRARQQQI